MPVSPALACKFISEQTSCTHLLSSASVIHSKGIIVSGAQHMWWGGRKKFSHFSCNFSHMFLITSWHWHQHKEKGKKTLHGLALFRSIFHKTYFKYPTFVINAQQYIMLMFMKIIITELNKILQPSIWSFGI